MARLVPIEHIAHDGAGRINRSARHFGCDLFLKMGVEALERTVGEIAHLQRAESLVEPFETQAALGEPLVRALQIAFDLRGREARLVAGRGKLDRLAWQVTARHDGILDKGLLPALDDPLLQTSGQHEGILDIVGCRRILAIAVDEFLEDGGGVRRVGILVVEATNDKERLAGRCQQGRKRSAHTRERIVVWEYSQLGEKRCRRIVGIGSGECGAREIARNGNIAGCGGERHRMSIVREHNVGRQDRKIAAVKASVIAHVQRT